MANVRAVRCPSPGTSGSKDAHNSCPKNGGKEEPSCKNVPITCLLNVTNITAATCPVVSDITLGRVIGCGAFGVVHIGEFCQNCGQTVDLSSGRACSCMHVVKSTDHLS
jgi:hypothetical protein